MKLIKLPIGGDTSVDGTFDYSAVLVGDAVLYNVNRGGHPLGRLAAFAVPDEGDDAPPGIEVLDDSLLGVTSKGRPVLAFRSGGRNPDGGWNGRSELWLGVGAPLPVQPGTQSVVVQTTQPGPAGPKGDRGDKGDAGPRGAQGAAGANGKDAVVDDATTDKLATLVAERVFTMPPAADHFGLPSYVQYGTRFQEMIAVMIHQALMQHVIMAGDEGAANLLASGYKPKIG